MRAGCPAEAQDPDPDPAPRLQTSYTSTRTVRSRSTHTHTWTHTHTSTYTKASSIQPRKRSQNYQLTLTFWKGTLRLSGVRCSILQLRFTKKTMEQKKKVHYQVKYNKNQSTETWLSISCISLIYIHWLYSQKKQINAHTHFYETKSDTQHSLQFSSSAILVMCCHTNSYAHILITHTPNTTWRLFTTRQIASSCLNLFVFS